MSHLLHLPLHSLIVSLALAMLLCTSSLAEEMTLISIGPRIGFSGKTPLFGKEQKHNFHLVDVAALIRLPWSWPLGHDAWKLETRLITSAGYLWAAGDGGLLATIVPNLALCAWGGLVTLDVGGGVGFLSNHQFGLQDLGGPVQAVTTAGIRLNPFSHAYAGFRIQHVSDAGIYGSSSLGVDMYMLELGYRF